MKTTIWLKQQPKKKIEYPDCYPMLNMILKHEALFIHKAKGDYVPEASYLLFEISRLEFRP